MAGEQLGPFDLEVDIIESNVTRNGPGTFRLGHNDVWGQLSVRFVGRADDDLKAELRKQVVKKKYTRFTFQLADTSRQAFERHCKDYHKYRGNGYLDNSKHPTVPHNHEVPCPICKRVVLPASTEKPMFDPSAKIVRSSSSSLRLADQAASQEESLKPWEMDDEGKRIRRRLGDGAEARPWMFDDPNLVPLEVEEMVRNDRELNTDVKKPGPEKKEDAAPATPPAPAKPDWLGDDEEEEPKKPDWLLEDE